MFMRICLLEGQRYGCEGHNLVSGRVSFVKTSACNSNSKVGMRPVVGFRWARGWGARIAFRLFVKARLWAHIVESVQLNSFIRALKFRSLALLSLVHILMMWCRWMMMVVRKHGRRSPLSIGRRHDSRQVHRKESRYNNTRLKYLWVRRKRARCQWDFDVASCFYVRFLGKELHCTMSKRRQHPSEIQPHAGCNTTL